MQDNELMVTIPMKRYEELIENETRGIVAKDMVIASKYSVDKEQIATVLGFKLPVDPDDQGGPF